MKIPGNKRFRKREFAVKLGEKPCRPANVERYLDRDKIDAW